MHRLAGRGEDGEERAADVLDVDDGSPGRAIALEEDLARGEGPGDEVVEHDVEAQPGGDPVGGRAAQEDGREGIVGQPRHVALHPNLGLAVSGDRFELRILVDRCIAPRAVVAARGGEGEAAHAGRLGQPGQPHRGKVVDLVGELGVQVAQWIVGEGGQMDDGIEPAQIGDLELAHILGEGPDRLAPVAEGGAAVEVGVDPDHLVAGIEEEGGHHRPDVAAASGEKDFHRKWKIRSLRQIRIRTGTRALAAASSMRRVDYATGYPPPFRSRTTG